MNSRDKRVALKPDTVIQLGLPDGRTGNFCVLEETGRGASCIVYRAVRGTVCDDYAGRTTHILKEFYPLGMKISRSEDGSLIYDEAVMNKMNRKKENFEQAAAVFAGRYEADTLHTMPRPVLAHANNTVYMISDIHAGCVLSEQTSLRGMKDIIEAMISLCAAIESIHEGNELYLDLKPSNIFLYELDGSFHVKLFDFDTVISADQLKNSPVLSYSSGWAAPELENGILKQISAKTDIFALGAIMFWLITQGQMLITKGPKSQLKQIGADRFPLNGYPVYKKCYGTNLKNRIRNILKNTLTVSPNGRYESVSLLKAELGELYQIISSHTVDLGNGRYYRRDLGEDGSEYRGNFFEDVKEGHGVYVFPGGTEIEGEWHNDEISGSIRYQHKDGISYEGGWKDDTFNGEGTMNWPDGTLYTGQWLHGDMHGRGKMIWPDGTWYEGDWISGERCGEGEMDYLSGIRYKGHWISGRFNGEGEMTWTSGHHYTGSFEDNRRNGFGRMEYPDGNIYEGNWQNDIKEGYGKYTFAMTKTVYTGEFSGNVREGYGEIQFADGEYYAGQWADDKRNGFGAVRYPGDRICTAQWKDGKRNGKGTISWADGSYYTGGWQNDVPHGKGTFVYSDGREYTGLFKDGKRHGYGKMVWPDGAFYEGEWAEGTYEGSGQMTWETGETYSGSWHEGRMHGHGVLKDQKGWIYDTEFVSGQKHGRGRRISPDFRRVDICTWENGQLLEWHPAGPEELEQLQ